MSPVQRAARALHQIYNEEKGRSGVQFMPTWEQLTEDGRFYFTHRVRAVLTAIRDPSEAMIYANSEGGLGFNDRVISDWQAMIDAALEEG